MFSLHACLCRLLSLSFFIIEDTRHVCSILLTIHIPSGWQESNRKKKKSINKTVPIFVDYQTRYLRFSDYIIHNSDIGNHSHPCSSIIGSSTHDIVLGFIRNPISFRSFVTGWVCLGFNNTRSTRCIFWALDGDKLCPHDTNIVSIHFKET